MNKTNYLLPCVLGVFGFAAAVSPLDGDAMQGESQDPQKPTASYVGSQTCKKCHGDQHKDWKKTKMALSFELLKPGERAEAKVKAGLDPEKDYTRDPECLPCHTTGWGEPSGYKIPPLGDSKEAKKAQNLAKSLQGVQCEACHGPSSLVVEYKTKHEDYQWKDLEAKKLLQGVEFPTKETCAKCHNDKSPFVEKGFVFDFEKRTEEGTHKHHPMAFDHGCPHKHTPTKKKKPDGAK